MRGQTTHLDPDVLARFRAGLIAGRRGDALAAHLADCDRCAALDQGLTEVSVLLAAVPPPTLPADVANRLDMVLAAEVADRKDYSERAGGDSPRARETAGRPARLTGRRRFRLVALRVLAPAAAVVLAAAGYGLSQLGGHPVSGATTPRSFAAPAAGTGQRSSNPHNLPEEARPTSALWMAVSHVDYLRGTLEQQLEAELRASPAVTQVASKRIAACVLHVTGGTIPVLVQSARFQGQPATVIVVSESKGDMAWVVGSGCSGTSEDLLDTVTLP